VSKRNRSHTHTYTHDKNNTKHKLPAPPLGLCPPLRRHALRGGGEGSFPRETGAQEKQVKHTRTCTPRTTPHTNALRRRSVSARRSVAMRCAVAGGGGSVQEKQVSKRNRSNTHAHARQEQHHTQTPCAAARSLPAVPSPRAEGGRGVSKRNPRRRLHVTRSNSCVKRNTHTRWCGKQASSPALSGAPICG